MCSPNRLDWMKHTQSTTLRLKLRNEAPPNDHESVLVKLHRLGSYSDVSRSEGFNRRGSGPRTQNRFTSKKEIQATKNTTFDVLLLIETGETRCFSSVWYICVVICSICVVICSICSRIVGACLVVELNYSG